MIYKVFTFTVNNSTSNDVVISYLKNIMERWNSHPLKGAHLQVRRYTQILNLIVNDGLWLKNMSSSISKIMSAVHMFVSHLVVWIGLGHVLKKLGGTPSALCLKVHWSSKRRLKDFARSLLSMRFWKMVSQIMRIGIMPRVFWNFWSCFSVVSCDG